MGARALRWARARARVVRATARRAVARDVRMRGNALARVAARVRSEEDDDDDDDDARRGELRARATRGSPVHRGIDGRAPLVRGGGRSS
mmetsp:Transcript_5902/g.19815  ORF Transcript_5902/g.19815 Transcript_5902/m.19815 type:complete len:89 (-) Transcript_5902:88-354(-)